jgi:hypothetical protein
VQAAAFEFRVKRLPIHHFAACRINDQGAVRHPGKLQGGDEPAGRIAAAGFERYVEADDVLIERFFQRNQAALSLIGQGRVVRHGCRSHGPQQALNA